MVKLRITPQELQTLRQTEIFHVKRQFFDRLSLAFSQWQQENIQSAEWQSIALPIDLDRNSVKISRGENYLGLPWMMADMPRHFGKEDVLAFRLFFWWGHYFTATWHLKGMPLQVWWHHIRLWLPEKSNVWVSYDGDEWQHEVSVPTYERIETSKLCESEIPPSRLKITVVTNLEDDWSASATQLFKALIDRVA